MRSTATRYRVVHRTSYRYESPVSASYGEAHLLPRAADGQRVTRSWVDIDPVPSQVAERSDYFGNRVVSFSIHHDHDTLTVTATSEVERAPSSDEVPEGPAWEAVRDAVRSIGRADDLEGPAMAPDAALLGTVEYTLSSPAVALFDAPGLAARLADYAAPSFPPGASLPACVHDLAVRIHDDFEYRPGSTSVQTPLSEVLDGRRGVCQDFAHVGIGCLRAMGLPARYVSGYLETVPPPGKERLTGADVSHAWFSAFVPGSGWFDVDPTNRRVVGTRHLVTAWGRDYSDVPPIKGVIFTESARSEMSVSVDVLRVDGTN